MIVYFGLILAKKAPPWAAAFKIIWQSRRVGILCYSARNC